MRNATGIRERKGVAEMAYSNLRQPEILGAGCFPSNDVVPFDHCGDTDAFVLFILLLVNSDNSSVGANEDFSAACDFRW